MKLLLDENLPKKLKAVFGSGHEVYTVGDMNWNGTKNGALLGLMVMNNFEGFVTIDKKLQHQQNLEKFPILLAIFDAPSNKVEILKPYVEKLLEMLNEEDLGNLMVVSI